MMFIVHALITFQIQKKKDLLYVCSFHAVTSWQNNILVLFEVIVIVGRLPCNFVFKCRPTVFPLRPSRLPLHWKKQSTREGGAEWTSKGLGPQRQSQSPSKCATTWELMFLWWGSTSFVCIVHIWPSLFKYSQKACDKNCLHCNSLQYTAYTVYTAMWPVAGCTDCVTGWLDIP